MPLRAGTTPLKLNFEYEDWLVQAMSHGDYDDFWKSNGIDVVNHVAEFKDVPTYQISGWFDSNLGATSLNYIALSKARRNSDLRPVLISAIFRCAGSIIG